MKHTPTAGARAIKAFYFTLFTGYNRWFALSGSKYSDLNTTASYITIKLFLSLNK